MSRPPELRGIYKNGRFYWISRMIAGKRNCVSLETEDLSEAISRAQDLRDHPILESGDLLVHAVHRYVKCRVQSGDWSLSTERSKGYFIVQWAKEMGAKVTPRHIGSEQLKRWHAKRRTEVTESTAFGNLMTIQGFFHWAKEERLCDSNPVLPLTSGKSKTRIRPPRPGGEEGLLHSRPAEPLARGSSTTGLGLRPPLWIPCGTPLQRDCGSESILVRS